MTNRNTKWILALLLCAVIALGLGMAHAEGGETYAKVMDSEDGRAHPYVAARIMMNNEQWGQYLWISHHGSLAGYRKNGEG